MQIDSKMILTDFRRNYRHSAMLEESTKFKSNEFIFLGISEINFINQYPLKPNQLDLIQRMPFLMHNPSN